MQKNHYKSYPKSLGISSLILMYLSFTVYHLQEDYIFYSY